MAKLAFFATITPANDTSPGTFETHLQEFMEGLTRAVGGVSLHHTYRTDGSADLYVEATDGTLARDKEIYDAAARLRIHPHRLQLQK